MRTRKLCKLLKATFVDGLAILWRYKKRKFHPDFLKDILTALDDKDSAYVVKFLQNGLENPTNTIALLRLDKIWIPTAGFFALFQKMLCGLSFSDRLGYIPVADNWTGCPYEEDLPINGTTNVFEYYFKPLSNISAESANHSYSVVIPTEMNMGLPFWDNNCEWYKPNASYIEYMGSLFKKYIQLNDIVGPQISTDISVLLQSKRTLGVHYRGTDFKINANGHPVSITAEDYIIPIKAALETQQFDQIFLATDDMEALELFNKVFENIVHYIDVFRTTGNTSVAYTETSRPNHKYRLGYEVVRDVYTLATCDGLIAGESQVSIAARIFNKGTGKAYTYTDIIQKGINRNNVEWMDLCKQRGNKRKS